jgi:restriction system protein
MSASAGSAALPGAATHELASLLPVGQVASPRMLVGILVAALVASAVVAVYQRIRVSRSGIAGVDRMDVKTFEAFLAALFRDLGYDIEGSRVHGDFAAELVVAKDGTRTVVEGKRWSKHLGVTAVQATLGAMADYHCDTGIVVANRQFTRQAKKLAKASGIALWDRERLVGKLLGLHGVPGELPGAPVAIPELAATVAAPPAESGPPIAQTATPVAVPPPAAVPRPGPSPARRPVAAPAWTPGSFAACALCGVSVSKDDRITCVSQPGRFGGQIYCHAHQQLIRGARA